MTLKQMIYFLQIAETGNLTRAAQLLNVSQPPLSYQLKCLEEELGVSLFSRDARGLHITQEGEYFQERARMVLEEVEQTVKGVQEIGKKKPFHLNIGTVSSINMELLPMVIKQMEEHIPGLVMNVYDGDSERVLDLLEKGTVEIGIIREPFNRNQYESLRLNLVDESVLDGDYMVACGQADLFSNYDIQEIKLSELVESPLIVTRRFEESLLANCRNMGVEAHIISRNDSILTSLEWAGHGLGVAIMPLSSSYLSNQENIIVKKIVEPVFYSNLYMVWKRGAVLSDAVKHIMELLEKPLAK